MLKSNNAAIIEAMGNISRGKYIFVTKLIFEATLGIALESEVARKVHGKRAVKENNGYGMLSLGILMKYENMNVNITIIDNG